MSPLPLLPNGRRSKSGAMRSSSSMIALTDNYRSRSTEIDADRSPHSARRPGSIRRLLPGSSRTQQWPPSVRGGQCLAGASPPLPDTGWSESGPTLGRPRRPNPSNAPQAKLVPFASVKVNPPPDGMPLELEPRSIDPRGSRFGRATRDRGQFRALSMARPLFRLPSFEQWDLLRRHWLRPDA